MKAGYLRLLVIFLVLCTLQGLAAPKKKTKIKTRKKPLKTSVSQSVQPAKPPQSTSQEKGMASSSKSSWAIKGVFGLNRWEGVGFWSGVGIGYVPKTHPQLRLGIEGTILLVSQGSLSSLLFSAQWMPAKKSFGQEGASLGFLVGPGFSGGGLPKNPTLLVLFAEGAWNEKLSESVQLQLALRAGKIGSDWAVQPGLLFHFLL